MANERRGLRRGGGAASAALIWFGSLAFVVRPAVAEPGPIAARVAGEPIYLAELTEGASSLALVGHEDIGDQPGTRERLLERLIAARILYLDGLERRLDQSPRYRDDLSAMSDSILAARRLETLRQTVPGCGPSSGGRPCATSTAELREREVARLRAGLEVIVDEKALAPGGAADRDDQTTVARVGGEEVRWRRVVGEVREPAKTPAERVGQVQRVVATHLLAAAARAAGLHDDPGFQEMVAGWKRGELVKLVREEIAAQSGLDEAGVAREYELHRANFSRPEQRRVQEIVVRSRAEADEIRQLLESPPPGTTFYTVARDRSIAPQAKQTLGVVGWISRGQGLPALGDAAFALAPGEIGAPIETEAGFHVIRVLEERPAEALPLDDHLRRRIRDRWNANRIAEYADHLAKTKYPVTLYPEVYQPQKAQTAAAK